ncbi:uncharacterized protein ARMOST_08255 [Armillaria ostoyae]|uniref:HNH nuclease domain-containing protein n=1 Tax=Armillaria ostoyae TaxID=47428 RepID=A0A284R854_ARMOS|nr:uncharacterized protein ARMOST_08255 [Armillaria ostoyae]
MERAKVFLSAFFDDTPHTLPNLFDAPCQRLYPATPFQNGDLLHTGRFLYHLIQQSKRLQLTTKVSLLIRQVMAANGVPADVLHYVSNASEQADVTPEEYRDTLRACCRDYWDWSLLVNFAHEYFIHLGLVMYDLSQTGYTTGGGETPQTPHFQSLEEIQAALGTSGHSGQKELIMLAGERDGKYCLVTNLLFQFRHGVLGTPTVKVKLAHICPTKLANPENPLVHETFSVFWDDEGLPKRFADLVNRPENCMLIWSDPRDYFAEMCWAIEAIPIEDTWRYHFIKVGGPTFPFEPASGTQIRFGVEGETFKEAVPLPSPDLCNIRLAVTKVMRFSGAAEVVDSWRWDYEEGPDAIGGVLGHPYADMIAMERLEARLGSVNNACSPPPIN